MKLSLTVGPLIRSPDTTTYELKNVLIYVDRSAFYRGNHYQLY